MSVYQVRIKSYEAAANGQVNFQVSVMLRTGTVADPQWVDAVNGQRTVVLDADAVNACYDNPVNNTNGKRLKAVEDLIKAEVLSFGIDKSDQAFLNLQKIMNLPDDVIVRSV
jgi:hypothetical protein